MSKNLKLIIEALLFSSDKPVAIRELNRCVPDVTPANIRKVLMDLQEDYESLDRSYVLKEIAEGFQFRTRPEYASYISLMFQSSPTRLSKAALETLAIIAYKQPILRQEIERIRGVDVGGILKTLLEKQLIKILGRKNLPGRPLIYGTTKRFLEVFDLKDIDSLPKLKEIKDFGAEEYEPKPTNESKESEEKTQEPEQEPQLSNPENPATDQ